MVLNFKSIVKENVSRETFDLINKYVDSLLFWNKKINLVSKNLSQDDLYGHILDGIFAADIIQNYDKSLIDIGSGAGLPGMIMLFIGYQNVYLVEKNKKQASFMTEFLAQNNLIAKVINQKIESVYLKDVDIIISKAMTDIDSLLSLTKHISQSKTSFFLFKDHNQFFRELNSLNHQEYLLQYHINPYRKDRKKFLLSLRKI